MALIAPPQYGANIIVGSVTLSSWPIVRLALPASSDASGVLIGNLFSDALDDAFGFRLFGYGLPFEYGLSIVKAQSHLLGRFVLAVVDAESAPEELLRALLSLDARSVKVVAAFDEAPSNGIPDFVRVISESDLAMTLDEAIDASRSVLDETKIKSLWTRTKGAYLEFMSQANRSTNLPPLQLVSRPSSVPAVAAEHLTSLFVRQGRWIEALEVALQHDRGQALVLFRQCARIVLDQGLADRLWALIASLDAESFEGDDELMYLYFVAAMSVNRHRELARRVVRYLEGHEAPDLRARWAVAIPTSESPVDAERAFNALKNVNTARALAFVRTMENRSDEAVTILGDALEMAQAAEDERQVCAIALDTSHALTFAGKFASAKLWARWGLDRHGKKRVGDELLRLNLVTQVAYLQLITDEPDASEAFLNSVVLPETLAGVPMMEALVSTRGDLAFVKGEYGKALGWYEKNYDQLPVASIGFGALDVAKALIRLGRPQDASATVREAEELARRQHPRSPGVLALKIAKGHVFVAQKRIKDAIAAYSAVSSSRGGSDAPAPYLVTQAVIGEAIAHAMYGDTSKALALLRESKECWSDLGLSGWTLFAVDAVQASKLRGVLHRQGSIDRLEILGTRRVTRDGLVTRLSLRYAEAAALLALRETGYRAEELLLELYGDDGKMGSLKALISRMRKTLPLRSRPYRLEEDLMCDVVELEAALAAGRLREALELYKGPLLPESEAPGIVRARERIDEAVRQAVLHSGEGDLVVRLARKFPEDLELWEKARELTPKDDPAYPLIRARIRRIRGEWGL